MIDEFGLHRLGKLLCAVISNVLLLVCLPAWGQFRVDVVGVGVHQLPIAVVPFRGEEAMPQKMAAIILADLARSGQFRVVDSTSAMLNELEHPDLPGWKKKGADALVAGSATRLANGHFDVRFRLWDSVAGRDLGGQSYQVTAGDLRLAAHKMSDFIYEKLTGDKGAFSTRLAYVTKTGQQYQLTVADADGENAQPALSSPEPIISPAWSPSGTQLAYVSFESRKPVVYAHEVVSGKRRLIANFKGSNSAPAWSPDGGTLAVTLSRDGGSQLFAINVATGESRRLAQSSAIDTEPVYSPDGKNIYFVSDRSGAPQIYRMPAEGGEPERITFNSSYNISPALSPDGRWLAFVSRIDGDFKLQLMELASGTVTSLTKTTADEHPSFAPNSRLIIYATRIDGAGVLMTSTTDGAIKTRLTGRSGDIREPDWGPFQKQ